MTKHASSSKWAAASLAGAGALVFAVLRVGEALRSEPPPPGPPLQESATPGPSPATRPAASSRELRTSALLAAAARGSPFVASGPSSRPEPAASAP